jgi:twitching motility protein PilT
MDITQLLAFSVKNKASDLHLSAGLPPMIRVHGDVRRINVEALDHKSVHDMVYDIMNDAQRKHYEDTLECDFSFEIQGLARFRVNAFNQNRGAGAVFRTIPSKILTLEQLNAPKVFADLALKPRGMVLVHRAHRFGQEHHAGGDGQPPERKRVRPRADGGRPDRVRAREQEVPDQPARGGPAHAELRQRAAQRAARGPRRHPGGRNARPGDHPPGADRRRDRPPGVRHPAHQQRGQDHRPRRRRVPGRREGDGARDAVRIAGGGDLADAVQAQGRQRPRGRARDHDRHLGHQEPDPREQDRADVQSIQTGQSLGMQTLDQNLADLVRRNVISPAEARSKAKIPENFPG